MKESSVKSLRKKKTKNTLKEINSLCSLLFLDNDFTVSFSTISCVTSWAPVKYKRNRPKKDKRYKKKKKLFLYYFSAQDPTVNISERK